MRVSSRPCISMRASTWGFRLFQYHQVPKRAKPTTTIPAPITMPVCNASQSGTNNSPAIQISVCLQNLANKQTASVSFVLPAGHMWLAVARKELRETTGGRQFLPTYYKSNLPMRTCSVSTNPLSMSDLSMHPCNPESAEPSLSATEGESEWKSET